MRRLELSGSLPRFLGLLVAILLVACSSTASVSPSAPIAPSASVVTASVKTPEPIPTLANGLPARGISGWRSENGPQMKVSTAGINWVLTAYSPLIVFKRFAARGPATQGRFAAIAITVNGSDSLFNFYRSVCSLNDQLLRSFGPTQQDEGFYRLINQVLGTNYIAETTMRGPVSFTTALVFEIPAAVGDDLIAGRAVLKLNCQDRTDMMGGKTQYVRDYGTPNVVGWSPPPPYDQ